MNPTRTPEHREIYAHHADQYELLISREDFESNIFRKLNELETFDEKDVIELGTGTGRLARMLAPTAKSVHAFDASAHMLAVAAAKLLATGLRNWRVAVADHRRLPLPDRAADIAISGWGLVYLVVWNEKTWERELAKGLSETVTNSCENTDECFLSKPCPPDILLRLQYQAHRWAKFRYAEMPAIENGSSDRSIFRRR